MNHSSQPHVAGSHRLLHGVVAALLAGFAIGPAVVGAASVSPALIYGIDNDNDIYEVDPVSKTTTLVLSQATEGGLSNSLAYDITRENLFFIGPDFKLKYWTKASGTAVNDVGTSALVADDPNNAAYYNNAYWFFGFNSNVLNKVSLSYSGTGAGAVPTVSGTQTYSIAGMNLPNPGTGLNTNTFGDIAINLDTGMLYASTTRGRFYSLDLNGDPTNTFVELAVGIGPENTHGLQLSYNTDSSILYGHSYETGDWYEVSLANGARTSLNYSTTTFGGKGFRDLGGAAVVPEPSALLLAGMGGVGGLAWNVMRRRRAA